MKLAVDHTRSYKFAVIWLTVSSSVVFASLGWAEILYFDLSLNYFNVFYIVDRMMYTQSLNVYLIHYVLLQSAIYLRFQAINQYVK